MAEMKYYQAPGEAGAHLHLWVSKLYSPLARPSAALRDPATSALGDPAPGNNRPLQCFVAAESCKPGRPTPLEMDEPSGWLGGNCAAVRRNELNTHQETCRWFQCLVLRTKM